jgi:hypothetical protein
MHCESLLFCIDLPKLSEAQDGWTHHSVLPNSVITLHIQWKQITANYRPVQAMLHCWRGGQQIEIMIPTHCIIVQSRKEGKQWQP